MPTNKTIMINGRVYDAVTGLPVKSPKPAPKVAATPVKPVVKPKAASVSAAIVHARTQRSQTLQRRIVKKPAANLKPQTGRLMDVARSPRVSRFAPHPITKPVASAPAKAMTKDTPDKQPQVHPLAERALARTAPLKGKPTTAKEVKEAAIEKALAATRPKPVKKRHLATWKKRLLIAAACVAVLIGAGFAVYYLVPSISVGLAATQAGVKASYPKYVPDGYHLSHPVTYSDGEVVLTFRSNSNDNDYTITQTRSSWDSTAVLDNVVRKDSGENYATTKERGLTIYFYANNRDAAWVNGGVLYVIHSNASLSGDQIRRIATSL